MIKESGTETNNKKKKAGEVHTDKKKRNTETQDLVYKITNPLLLLLSTQQEVGTQFGYIFREL